MFSYTSGRNITTMYFQYVNGNKKKIKLFLFQFAYRFPLTRQLEMLGAGVRLSGPCQLLCHTLCPVGAIWSLTSDIGEQAKGKCAEPVDDKRGSAGGGKWLRYGATGAVSKSGTVMELNVRNQPLNATYRQCVCVCVRCVGVYVCVRLQACLCSS